MRFFWASGKDCADLTLPWSSERWSGKFYWNSGADCNILTPTCQCSIARRDCTILPTQVFKFSDDAAQFRRPRRSISTLYATEDGFCTNRTLLCRIWQLPLYRSKPNKFLSCRQCFWKSWWYPCTERLCNQKQRLSEFCQQRRKYSDKYRLECQWLCKQHTLS